jgi:predicted SAM-dependent methyltransferase
VLHHIDRKGLGLEIGPSYNPIAPKRAGFNVHVLDHASAPELREKYRSHDVDVEAIEEVDFVWKGEPLDELVGAGAAYDWIVASHVIEHTPDLVAFLSQCERLLKPSGILSLAVPDKRYCFDYFRFPSSTGDVLQAHLEKRVRHAPGAVFDHVANGALLDGAIVWEPGDRGTFTLMQTFGEAVAALEQARSAYYLDIHNWRFTPSSFRLILGDLHALGLIGLVEKGFFDTEGWEFFVALGKGSAPSIERLPLMLRMLEEMRDGCPPASEGNSQAGRRVARPLIMRHLAAHVPSGAKTALRRLRRRIRI